MSDDLFAGPTTAAFPPPRAFQDAAHRELRAGYTQGHQRQLVMAPTGAGKTYLALRVCHEALQRGRRVLFICDRNTLIRQTVDVARAYGMPTPGVIQADNPMFALWRPFQVASAQTLQRRGTPDDYAVVIVDEAHTMYESTTEFVMSTKAAVVGLSATPFTEGLADVYSRVINAATMDELTRLGVLTPFRVRECVRPDMTGAKTTGGEWTQKEASERGGKLIGDVVKEWLEHAREKKTIIFGPKVDYAENLVEKFRAVGVSAALFTGQTTESERAELLREYRKPDSTLRILVSVEALAKGFDVPDVECVVDARPLRKSLSTYVQMIGRGLRSAPGKTECLIIDHSGNARRFRDDLAALYFDGLAELKAGEEKDKTVRETPEDSEVRACPSCGYSPVGRRCVACGFEARRTSLVEHDEGESEELDILGTGATAYAASRQELHAMLLAYEHARSQRRVESGRDAGKPSGAAAWRYRELTGSWPPRGWPTDARAEPSVALRAKLRSMDIAFAKGAVRRRG